MFNVKQYGGNYYGSLEMNMDNIKTSKNVIFQLTPDRALQMKERNPDTCLILILPPSIESLAQRRNDRSIDRIKNDIQNLEIAKDFDYVVVNDDLEIAYSQILNCVQKFKSREEYELSASNNTKTIN